MTKCLRIEEVGKILGVSRASAYALTRKQGFPVVRVGRRLVVPETQLQSWLERQAGVCADDGNRA